MSLIRLTVSLLLLAALAGCAASHQPMGPAQQAGAFEGDYLIARDGARLPLRRWLPRAQAPDAVIVALHGMNDYANAFDAPARAWAGQGVATYAYDQRGFGASAQPGIWPDTATLLDDLSAAVDAVRSRHPGTPLFLLGESMGGAVVLAALAAPDAPGARPLARRVDGAILSAPALWSRDALNPFFRLTLWTGYRLMPGLAVRPPANLKIQPSDNIEMLRALGRDPLVLKRTRIDALNGLMDLMTAARERLDERPRRLPILVLYGEHEQVLARDAVGDVIRTLHADAPSRTRLAIYPYGYHMLLRDLCASVVWQDVLAWMNRPEAPLPSGADTHSWKDKPPPPPVVASALPGVCPATVGPQRAADNPGATTTDAAPSPRGAELAGAPAAQP